MAGTLNQEARMTIKVLQERGCSHLHTARVLGVSEGAVRYHLRRQAQGAVDGRSRQRRRAAAYAREIDAWLEARGDKSGKTVSVSLAELHEWLLEEHGYQGSLRSVQRYYRERFPRPRRRARRRVETPPGAQSQVDWAEFRGVMLGGRSRTLYAFEMQLSHSRRAALVWSERKDELSWQHVHNEGFRRIQGVAATNRVDNEKTAVSRGAGSWGVINPAYRRYAEVVRFHVDPCPPRAPEHKGKIERRIRDERLHGDPRRRHWDCLEELQSWTDRRVEESARRRRCPATGTTVWEAWQAEKPHLGELRALPEPFDLVATRRVSLDCLVNFEGRQYTVPFQFVGRTVEVRGCAGRVQVVADCTVLADYPRHTKERLLIDPRCYEGSSTDEIVAPVPLGRMGRKLAEIAALEPQRRPLDLYAALAEVAR